MATSPRVSSVDRLPRLLVVRLRVGVEALAALLAEAALGDEPAQHERRGEALAMVLGGALQPLEHHVETLDVRLHEGRQEAAARIEAGPGHHADVDVAVGGDALLEDEARLDEGLEGQQLDELVDVRRGVALDVGLAGGRVEAVAPGLGAELALGHQALHRRGHVEAIAVGLVQVLGDEQDRVEAEQVDQKVGAHRHDAGRTDAVVDGLDREALLLLLAPDLRDAGVEDPVDHEAGHLGAGDRLLADRLGEVDRAADGLGRRVVAFDDLDQRHDRGRVEVVKADDLVGPLGRRADLGDRERRGVRGEDRVPRGDRVELGEDGMLDRDALGHGLDDEVDVAEALVGGGAVDAPDDLLHLRRGLLLGELALLHQPGDLALGDVAGLVEAGLDELVLDVLEHHGDARGGDGLGDLAAHGAGADDRGLEHEHGAAGYREPSRSAATSVRKRRSVRSSDSRCGRRMNSRSTTAIPGRCSLSV